MSWGSQKEHCLNVQAHWSGLSGIFLEWSIGKLCAYARVCVCAKGGAFSAIMNYVNFNEYEIKMVILFTTRKNI